MNTEVIKQQTWWGRNWKWFVPVVCGVLILLVTVVISFICLVFGLLKNNDAYKMALNRVQEDQSVITAFGSRVEPKWYVLGSIHTSGPSGTASLQIPIAYKNKSGSIYVEATKQMGQWIIRRLEVEINDTGKRLVLIKSVNESETK
jgi:hypothetical protein